VDVDAASAPDLASYNNGQKLGTDAGATTHFHNGKLDEVQFYTRNLTGSEWSDIYLHDSERIINNSVFNNENLSVNSTLSGIKISYVANIINSLSDTIINDTIVNNGCYDFDGSVLNWTINASLNYSLDMDRVINYTFINCIKLNSTIITPAVAYTNDTLVGYANITGDENVTINVSCSWYVDSSIVQTDNKSNITKLVSTNIGNLSSSNFNKSDEIVYECFSLTDYYNSSKVNSSVLTISNKPASVNVTTIPSTGTVGTSYDISITISDIDDDVMSSVVVEITDPNLAETNFSMTTSDNVSYLKSFTPIIAGTHSYTFYLNDSENQTRDDAAQTTVVSAAVPPPGGGGGGGGFVAGIVEILTQLTAENEFFKVETGFGGSVYDLTMDVGESRLLRLVVRSLKDDQSLLVTLSCVNDEPEGFCDNVNLSQSSFVLKPQEVVDLTMRISLSDDVVYGDKFIFEIKGIHVIGTEELVSSVRTNLLVSKASGIRLWLSKFVGLYDFGFPFPKVIIYLLFAFVGAGLFRLAFTKLKKETKNLWSSIIFVSAFFITSLVDNVVKNIFIGAILS
jgi:hypothetical protein